MKKNKTDSRVTYTLLAAGIFAILFLIAILAHFDKIEFGISKI